MSTDADPIARTGATCAHCELPVPRAELDDSCERQFCCGGCRAVYGALHESGLERYYELREEARRSDESEQPARVTHRGFEHLDAADFRGSHVREERDGVSGVELRVDGLRCGACVWLLEALPRIEPGLVDCRVDGPRSTVRLRWRDGQVRLSRIAQRFDTLGYQLFALGDPEAVARERANDRAWFARIGIA